MTFILSVQKVPQGTDQGQMSCVSSKIAFFHYRRCMICHKGPVKTTSWACENRLCSPWEPERPKVKAQGNGCVSGLGAVGLLTLLRPPGCDHRVLLMSAHLWAFSQAKLSCDWDICSPTQHIGSDRAANSLCLFPSSLFPGTQKKTWLPPAFRPIS